MTDTQAITSPNGRAPGATGRPPMSAVGVSGVAHHGGILVHKDYDAAWKGRARDDTIIHMLNDPLIGAILGGIEMMVRRVDWRTDSPDDTDGSKQAEEFVNSALSDMEGQWPGENLAHIMTGDGWGYCVLEQVFKRRLGPSAKIPSRYADGKTGWRRWMLLPQPTRYRWVFDDDGDPVALIQQNPQTYQLTEPVPLAKCIHIKFGARDNSPEGSTALRVAYNAWYYKQNLQRIQAIGYERHAAGLVVMRIPGTEIAQNTAAYQMAQNIVTGVRQDSQQGIVIASDHDPEGKYPLQDITLLAPSGGAGVPDMSPAINQRANEIAMALFMANVMRSGQDGIGTQALSTVLTDLFQRGIGAKLDLIADAITEQAILPLCRFNGIPPEQAPRLAHGDVEGADLAMMGKYLIDLAQAGVLVDTPDLRVFAHKIGGLPVPTVEEMEQQRAEEEAEAERQRQEALERMRQEQEAPSEDAEEPGDEREAAEMGEARTFAAPRPTGLDPVRVTVSEEDMAAAEAWFDDLMGDDHAGLLGAKVGA